MTGSSIGVLDISASTRSGQVDDISVDGIQREVAQAMSRRYELRSDVSIRDVVLSALNTLGALVKCGGRTPARSE